MLISKKVLIKKRGNKNIKYYTDLGYDTSLDKFKKSKLKYECTESEYMNSIGIYRIWDCGKIKFEKSHHFR